MTIKSIAATFSLLLISLCQAVSSAQTTQPGTIFGEALEQYQSMTAYSAEGTVTTDIDTGNIKTKLETMFSIKMKKPNQYLISWSQANQMMPAFVQSGAAWNDGSQPYFYMSAAGGYAKMSSDEMALASATGVSSGAASTIPSMFLAVFGHRSDPFSRLIDPQIEGSEQVDGDDCYIIGGSSMVSKKETYWISKSAHVIRKYSRSLEPPKGGMKLPQMTDQQLDDAIKASGQQVTDATRQQMKDSMKQAQETMKTANLIGTSTEIHHKISSSDLNAADFAFKPPADAPLKTSLFGGPTTAR